MTGLLLASCAGGGTYLLYTALVFGRRGLRPSWSSGFQTAPARRHLRDWMVQAGLAEMRAGELLATSGAMLVVGGLLGLAIFGAPLPAVALALFASVSPLASGRLRRQQRRAKAREAWPRMIEVVRG